MSQQSEIEASLLSRTRGMSREEIETLMRKYNYMADPLCHKDEAAESLIYLILKGEIPHADLM